MANTEVNEARGGVHENVDVATMHTKQLNLFKLIPNLDTEASTGYCLYSYKAPNYHSWEANVATPALKAKGYRVFTPWETGDHDSYGPLERHVKALREGRDFIIYYG